MHCETKTKQNIMEKSRYPAPPPAAAPPPATAVSRVKSGCLSAAASLREQARYVKAFFVGQGKKLTAKTEQEAAEADLATAKMQVEAADEAEETKKRLNECSN